MLDIFFISIGLVLIIEGLIYFFLANRIKTMIYLLSNINPKRIKNFSLMMVFIGFCLIYYIIRL